MTGSLFTATVEFRRPGAQQWEIIAQATDTLAGLVEWATPAQGALQRPVPPLSAAAVQGSLAPHLVMLEPVSGCGLSPQPKVRKRPWTCWRVSRDSVRVAR